MSTYHQPAHHTPTLSSDGTVAPSKSSDTSAQSSAAVALTMSWQLLTVILLPIVGGHVLDDHFHSAPIWVIVGILVGLAGTVLVVRQAMQQLSDIMNRSSKESK